MAIKITSLLAYLLLLQIITGKSQEVSVASEKIAVGSFNGVVSVGGGLIEIKYAPTYGVTVEGCRECVHISNTFKLLKVDFKDDEEGNRVVKVYVNTPALDEIKLTGGGEIVVHKGLIAKEKFTCTIKSGGKVDLSKLDVTSFYASIKDGGTLTLYAKKFLQGNITNGGSIEYLGDPTVVSDINGGGTIKQK
ncbi:MAG: GIN domain-containing protein [Bacteroidota bacterium]